MPPDENGVDRVVRAGHEGRRETKKRFEWTAESGQKGHTGGRKRTAQKRLFTEQQFDGETDWVSDFFIPFSDKFPSKIARAVVIVEWLICM
ncbi:unnamed protein product [Cylicostephanus goldi]|uniref:Uncharacterized protein n=1 Tax=Cylicostephanus goldi TaxID=71465 RepID=A0A3P6S1P4_CYLGO|nr:unnamed protein product [Cylicostephanus goldi]